MSDLKDVASVVSASHELLDDIRGGAIGRMKTEHEATLTQFGTDKQSAFNQFDTEKGDALGQFNTEKQAALNAFDQQGQAKINEVQTHLASSRDRQTHIRLTKNQTMLANTDGSFPDGWVASPNITATLLETVHSGIPVNERSALAQEFLSAINSNSEHFYGAFNIWQFEMAPVAAGTSVYLPFQKIATSQAVTTAAIVKHISGAVPYSNYCHGLEAGQPAKLCGRVSVISANNRNGYSNIHPRMTPEGVVQGGVIQIALPACVTGEVDLTNGAWGQFPFIGSEVQG